MEFAPANTGVLAGDGPALDTMNTIINSEMKREPEERELQRMAKFHDFLEMWRGSQNLCATHEESCANNMQMTAIRYISYTEVLSKHPGHSFIMMVRLHCSCWKYHLCHQLFLQ